MKQIIYILGILQIAAAIFVALGSKSAIHEILATTAFGFGVLSLGFGAVLGRLDSQSDVENIRVRPSGKPHEAPEEYRFDPKLR